MDKKADDFNSSLSFDCRMYAQDIQGSMAHATMLGAQGILPQKEVDEILAGLESILLDLQSGKLDFSAGGEDIHMFVEAELTKRIGDAGKRLHTARSRNDQVALDIRLYLRDEAKIIIGLIKQTVEAIVDKACETFCKYNGCGVSRDNCTKIGTCPNHNAFMDELMASLTNHR